MTQKCRVHAWGQLGLLTMCRTGGGREQPSIVMSRRGIERRGTVKSLPSALPSGRNRLLDGKKGQPELVVPTGLLMSGRLDSNQRPPEPHSRDHCRSQPPNFANASLLVVYELHSSHRLR